MQYGFCVIKICYEDLFVGHSFENKLLPQGSALKQGCLQKRFPNSSHTGRRRPLQFGSKWARVYLKLAVGFGTKHMVAISFMQAECKNSELA